MSQETASDRMFKKTLFIFRRDLRLDDNTGLLYALEKSKTVIPCFIFTKEQIEQNPYRSDACLQFMLESLQDLEEQIGKKKGKLYFFYDDPEAVVEKCIKTLLIDSVVVNRDYTPYSIKRDEKIASVCSNHRVHFSSFDDALLNPPENTLKKDGAPYTVFTPFFKNASCIKVDLPKKKFYSNYCNIAIDFASDSKIFSKILSKTSNDLLVKGGRKNAIDILKNIGSFKAYSGKRDYPFLSATTHLSAHLKFTTISAREVYHAIANSLGKSHELIRSLYWRDFFSSIAFFFPRVFQGPFHEKYNNVKWRNNKNHFEKWCSGMTGFPIVDAGMREMNKTGFMQNRTRMIAASFLTKDLHIDWRLGEQYFAQKLIDYDPAVNNGNWQWVAGTGCDAAPYFRIFNPWTQQKNFDPDCLYIKKWVPELEGFTSKEIHGWHKKEKDLFCDYPSPILDHAKEAKTALSLYKEYHLKNEI